MLMKMGHNSESHSAGLRLKPGFLMQRQLSSIIQCVATVWVAAKATYVADCTSLGVWESDKAACSPHCPVFVQGCIVYYTSLVCARRRCQAALAVPLFPGALPSDLIGNDGPIVTMVGHARATRLSVGMICTLVLPGRLYCIVLYCIVLYCILYIVLYCIALYCIIIVYRIILYCIVLYCISYYIVLYCIIIVYRIILYCIVLYCISYYIVLYCILYIVLYCIALYCISYCIVLYCVLYILLYCIVLYCILYIVLYCIVLYCILSIVLYCIVLYCIVLQAYCIVLYVLYCNVGL